MALDISAIYQGQSQPDIGQIYGEALKIKEYQNQVRQQNMLKQILMTPGNIGADGLPTENALKSMMQVDPAQASKFIGLQSQVDERKALTDEKRQKEYLELDNYVQKAVRDPATQAYQKALPDGPVAAQMAGQRVYDEGLAEIRASGRFGEDQVRTFDPHYDPARVATRTKLNALANSPKSGDVETLTNTEGVTFDHNKLTGQNRVVSAPPDSGLKAGDEYDPTGGVQKVGGGGMARSAAAMATQRYVQEHPQATAQDIADFNARFKTTEITGTAEAKGEATSLSKLETLRGSVESAEGNANRESDLVLSLLEKGGGKLPPALNKTVQNIRVASGSTDAAALRTALESFKNEYIKVLTTQSGVGGGTTTDAARREAESYINDGLTIDQIRRNIDVMKRSMANRSAAIEQEIGKQRQRVSAEVPSSGRSTAPASPGRSRADSYLRSHDTPQMRKFYDERYGAGAAKRLLSGG